jgi:hypothetical protein
MSIFEITIQNQRTPTEWPVLIKIELQDKLPIQINGTLQLSENDQEELSMLLYEPKNYGIFLGKALFRDKLYYAFREAFASTHKLMRVLLTIDTENSEQLKTLHWERLCVPIDNNSWEHLALNQRLPFSQYLPSSNLDRSYPVISQSDLRALVMVANPENLDKYSLAPLDVTTTFSGLKQAFGNIPCDTLANDLTDAVGKPTLNQLCQQLSSANSPYTILHIVCHGTVKAGENIVYWSDENNQVLPVKRKDLIERLRQLGNKEGLPYLTFLCSCSSGSPLGGIAQSLVRKLGMPAVVAMTDKVSIKTGLALAQNFYRQLRELGTVDIALQKAMAGLADRYDIVVPALFSSFRDRSLFKMPSAPAVQGQSVRKGIQALEELMTYPQVRDVVVAFRTDFQATCYQIKIISTYKDLHDSLHKLEFQCYWGVLWEARNFPDDEMALEILTAHELTLQQILEDIQEIITNSPLTTSETAWVADLEKGHQELHSALEQLDKRQLQRAIWLLNQILAIQPSLINNSLNTTAKALRLPDLVTSMTGIRDRLIDGELDEEKIGQFQEGANNLSKLQQNLRLLIQNHDEWQRIDLVLRRIETNLKYDIMELEMSWPELKIMVESQYRNLRDKWALSLSKDSESLESAVNSQDTAQVKRSFRSFRRLASYRFYRIDFKLKEICGELRHVGEHLNSVLQMLQ